MVCVCVYIYVCVQAEVEKSLEFYLGSLSSLSGSGTERVSQMFSWSPGDYVSNNISISIRRDEQMLFTVHNKHNAIWSLKHTFTINREGGERGTFSPPLSGHD